MKMPESTFRTLSEFQPFRRIVLAPAGSGTEYFLRFVDERCPGLREQIVGIIDRDPRKSGRDLRGCRISPSESIAELDPDLVLLTSSVFWDEIGNDVRKTLGRDVRAIWADSIREYLDWGAEPHSHLARFEPHLTREETLEKLSRTEDWYHTMPLHPKKSIYS